MYFLLYYNVKILGFRVTNIIKNEIKRVKNFYFMVVDCMKFCCYNRFTITERDRMIYKISSSG